MNRNCFVPSDRPHYCHRVHGTFTKHFSNARAFYTHLESVPCDCTPPPSPTSECHDELEVDFPTDTLLEGTRWIMVVAPGEELALKEQQNAANRSIVSVVVPHSVT